MVKKRVSWFRLRQRSHVEAADLKTTDPIEKNGPTLTPNLRALRLAVTASDWLLSMGVPANSVVSKALDITEAYCDHPVYVNISFDLITLSQVRGVEYEPLTLIRPVTGRDVNNMTVQSIQKLVYEIRKGKHTLSAAEAALDEILTEPITYPKWLPPAANAAIAPAAVVMFSTDWHALVISYIVALFVDRIVLALGRRAIAPFFRQVAGSIFVTVAAAFMLWLSHQGVHFFDGMKPTLLVVGGIMMLVSGLAAVGAVQDAIEEYFLTATARLMRAVLMTSGIVMGILIGLYIAQKLGMGIAVSPNPLGLSSLEFQLIGGAGLAAAYALSTQTRLRAILWTGIVGGGAVAILYASRHLGISVIPRTGLAAIFVGLAAALFSRLWRTPSFGVISAGILPLVPGLSLYNGLMQLANYPPSHPLFFRGVGTMFTVIGTALAIGAGASFGSMLGRPLHRHLTHTRNTAPFAAFMQLQLHADRAASRLKLARFALRRQTK